MFVSKIVIRLFTGKSASILIICAFIGLLLGCSAEGTINGPTIDASKIAIPEDPALEWVAPEDVGWSSAELQTAQAFAQQSGCTAAMALYDGKIFFARGNLHKNYQVHSIRMPLLSALYGIHLARDQLVLSDTLADLHLDDLAPGLIESEKQAGVEHLLMSRSGVYHASAAEDQTMIDTRPPRGSHTPGTFFYYNNWGFNALGTIFEQETGEDIFIAFKKEIADVLEMVDFSIDFCFYQYEWDKSLHPAYQFKMSVRDLAKFGVLYQQNGRWKDHQVVGSDWIDDSTMAYSTMPGTAGLGYGYLWKIFPANSDIGQIIGDPGYYHSGADGYALVVIPDLKLVIVVRYDSEQNWENTDSDAFELTTLIVDARIVD